MWKHQVRFVLVCVSMNENDFHFVSEDTKINFFIQWLVSYSSPVIMLSYLSYMQRFR